jgi:hypothetical protein
VHFWLVNSAQVNYDEVYGWLEGMKQSYVPAFVQQDPRVQHQLAAAVSAVSDFQKAIPLPRGYPHVAPYDAVAASNQATAATVIEDHRREMETLTIKDFLAERAEHAELTFLPRPGRLVSGLQVYALGKLSVVVDLHAGVIKAFVRDRWTPMGIDEVIKEAMKRKS